MREAARVDRADAGEVVQPRLLHHRAHEVADREGVAAGERRDRREADVAALLPAVPGGHGVDAEVRDAALDLLVRVRASAMPPGRASSPRPRAPGIAVSNASLIFAKRWSTTASSP